MLQSQPATSNQAQAKNSNQTVDYTQLKRIAIFAKVVERHSFAKAAESLSMSPSGVSEQVSALEAFLGTRLLHRTTRKLSLTLDGEAVLADAMTIVQSYEHICETLHQDDMSGCIRLTTTHDFAMYWLSPRLVAFRQRYPNVTFDLLMSDQKVDLVEQRIDLAIRIGRQFGDSSSVVRPLLQESLKIFASPSLFEQTSPPKTLDEVCKLPWVLLKQMYPTGKLALLCSDEQNMIHETLIEPTTTHRVDSPVVMVHLMMAGLGIGLLLPSICAKHVKEGKLMNVLPDWQSQQLTFSIMYSSRRQMPKRVQVFRDFLIAETL